MEILFVVFSLQVMRKFLFLLLNVGGMQFNGKRDSIIFRHGTWWVERKI